MLNQIHNIDCLIGMNDIPDKSIDMILCDLPYGTTKNKWDSLINLDLLWKQYMRIIKDNGAIVLTAQTPFDKVLGMSNFKYLRYEWIWEKDNATGFLNANRMPLKSHENILVFYDKPPKYYPVMRKGKMRQKGNKGSNETRCYGKSKEYSVTNDLYYPTSVIEIGNANQRGKIHPTQKPVELFEYLIKTYSQEGDVVLDNCIGSGTTAIACLNLNRYYIGFEKDDTYYESAMNRIEEWYQNE